MRGKTRNWMAAVSQGPDGFQLMGALKSVIHHAMGASTTPDAAM